MKSILLTHFKKPLTCIFLQNHHQTMILGIGIIQAYKILNVTIKQQKLSRRHLDNFLMYCV